MIQTDYSKKIAALLQREPWVTECIEQLKKNNAHVYLVGGCVRDIFFENFSTDIDIEVHGITMDQLYDIVSRYGIVKETGKSFGVLRKEKSIVEWSLPRIDSAGRKPQVIIDPSLDITKALMRRDLTINAMAIDIFTGKLIDPFNGLSDLKNRILRSPCIEKFIEDPLRFFRVMQFIGRFRATVDPQLEALCKSIDFSSVARERVEAEFEKLLLKSEEPSRGIRWLAHINRLHEIFPELDATRGVVQDFLWHPEGDVFEHTMQALDAAVHNKYTSQNEKLLILFAALCHDLGKVSTTKKDINGRIRSIGHDIVGVPLAQSMLKRITENNDRIKKVSLLVRYHMMPGSFVKQNASAAAYKRLAVRMKQVSLRELSLLAYADRKGRNGKAHVSLSGAVADIDAFVIKAREYGVYEQAEKPIIYGRDLMGLYPEGPLIGKLVAYAYDIQINRGIKDKERLLQYIAQAYKKG